MGENPGGTTSQPPPPMTVHCPHCSTGYLLPDHLVGPGGASVRCPNCAQAFVVLRGAGETGVPPAEPQVEVLAPATVRPPDASAGAGLSDAIAAELLDALVASLGEALDEARARGRVLSEHGPAILDAFAEYRRRAGPGDGAEAFREALRSRCGVDLTPRPRDPAP